jgi:hypothetical protein
VASQVAELKVGLEDDPSVRLQLVGIDLGQILDRVTHVDNSASRRRLFRELLLGELGIRDDGAFEVEHTVVWRGTRRTIEIVYGNVRDRSDLRDDAFDPSQDGRWRLVIDYPFDAVTYSAADDRARVIELRDAGPRRCVAWLPAFLTGSVLAKVATLVRIDYLLGGTRLDEAAIHLGPDDRQRARDLLRNQGNALRTELRMVLREAYGLARPDEDHVLDWSDHLVSLDPALRPRLDIGRPFADALAHLVDQCFAATYPHHPDLDPHRKGAVVTTAELRTVLDVVRRAADAEGGRIETDKAERPALQKLAHPLQLGEEHGGPFVLSRHWEAEFERRAAQAGSAEADIPVRQLREWIADRGLETRVANLVIATYAELARRAWVRAGQVVEPPATVDEVRDDMVLRRQRLPAEDAWTVAVERAAVLFGEKLDARVISPRSVARFGRIRSRVDQLRAPAAELLAVLETSLPRLGVRAEPAAARLRTAETSVRLLDALRRAGDPTDLVEALAAVPIDMPLITVSRSLSSAAQVTQALRNADWQLLDQLATLDTPAARMARESLATGAAANEDASPLAKALMDARKRVLDLIVTPPSPSPDPHPRRHTLRRRLSRHHHRRLRRRGFSGATVTKPLRSCGTSSRQGRR